MRLPPNKICLVAFACLDVLCPSQQFFSHVWAISYLPGLNKYYAENKCLAQGHNVVPGVSQTSDYLISSINT